MSQSSKGELVVKSVATAVVATAIVEMGQSFGKNLAKQPIVLFGLGLVAGYFTCKYRKEIITISSHTAEQGKEFILRQKDHINTMLAEIHTTDEQSDV